MTSTNEVHFLFDCGDRTVLNGFSYLRRRCHSPCTGYHLSFCCYLAPHPRRADPIHAAFRSCSAKPIGNALLQSPDPHPDAGFVAPPPDVLWSPRGPCAVAPAPRSRPSATTWWDHRRHHRLLQPGFYRNTRLRENHHQSRDPQRDIETQSRARCGEGWPRHGHS